MTAQLIELTQLGLLKISGADAAKFLQGQLTCDIHLINEKKSGFTAYCNAKGRVVMVATVFFFEGAYFLCLAKNLLCKTITLLTKYKLAAKVNLEDVTERYTVLGCLGQLHFIDDALDKLQPKENLINNDALIIRLPDVNQRYLIIIPNENKSFLSLLQQQTQFSSSDLWQLTTIENYIPIITNETSELFTPEMLNLIELGAVSFTKGCYLGQEIIARAHHLGKTKRSLIKATIKLNESPTAGTKIIDQNKDEVGNIVLTAPVDNHHLILAVVSETARNQLLFLDTHQDAELTLLSD